VTDRGAESVDSPVVVATVRALVPFVLTFALFTLFHGTSSVGGGFQGGVVAAAVVVTLGFAMGLEDTAAWLRAGRLTALVVAAPVVFGTVALAGVVAGGAVLQFDHLPVPKPSVYATEAVELGIGATVAAVVVVLFVALAGPAIGGERRDPSTGRDDRRAGDRGAGERP
jgi:multicomponent Na+:H+ antiporter subunit B